MQTFWLYIIAASVAIVVTALAAIPWIMILFYVYTGGRF
jgi:hypothetical protein